MRSCSGPRCAPVAKARRCLVDDTVIDGMDSGGRTMLACADATIIDSGQEWFGPFANDVRENRVVGSLAGVFDTSASGPNGAVELDPLWRENRGRVLHFAPGFDRYFGIPLEEFGIAPTPTLDGNMRGDFGVGPYE